MTETPERRGPRLVIGSRRSRLAREQAERVGRRVREARPDVEVVYAFMTTEGDRVLDRPLPEVGGKGLFTAELEAGLRAGTLDLAVHSLKDLPAEAPPDLVLLCVPEREDPRDVLVSSSGAATVEELPEGATVGTSSLRRRAQLLRARPDCRPVPIRGNVETRLDKLHEGRVDALLLAAAGLRRLGRLGEAAPLDPEAWLPAPGQGSLAVQGRPADETTREVAAAIEDAGARSEAEAERAFLAGLGGDCRTPLAALARRSGDRLILRGAVFSSDGREAVEGERSGPAAEAARIGRELAEACLERGADRVLAGLRAGSGP